MDKTLDLAWLLMGSNRFDRSEQEIRKHLNENPDDPHAHTMLAMCLFDLSRHDEAIESAKKAIELERGNPSIHWILSCMYIRLHQLDSAEEYLFKAIELDPICPDYHASLSEFYLMRGLSNNLAREKKKECFEKGAKSARIGLEFETEHFKCKLYLIKNLLSFNDDNYITEIIDLAEQLLSRYSASAEAHEIYAYALIFKFRKTKSTTQNVNRILAILQESLRLEPNRSYSKDLACHLLERHYSILSIYVTWLGIFLKFATVATIPLLLLTFYFYNSNGFQLYPTATFAALTLVSLILILDLTQSQVRIYLNIQHRKFLRSEIAIDLLRWIVVIITVIGLSWQQLPVFIINFLVLSLWLCIPAYVMCVFSLVLYLTNKRYN